MRNKEKRKKITLWTILFYILCATIFFFLIFPITLVFPISFGNASFFQFPPKVWSLRWYREFFSDSAWIDSVLLSVKIALMTVLISVLIGVTAATAVNRADIKGKGVLTAFLILPIIIPVIVFAIGIYYIFSGWHFVGKPLSMALAHSVLAIPYVFINTSAAYQTLDPRLEQAALSLGASPIIVFMKITIPLIRPGVLSGMLFAFVVSFDELIVSKYIGGIYVKTLPLQLWDGLRSEMTPIIASVSSLVITCYAIVIIAGQSMKNRANRTAKIMRINEKEMDRDLI